MTLVSSSDAWPPTTQRQSFSFRSSPLPPCHPSSRSLSNLVDIPGNLESLVPPASASSPAQPKVQLSSRILCHYISRSRPRHPATTSYAYFVLPRVSGNRHSFFQKRAGGRSLSGLSLGWLACLLAWPSISLALQTWTKPVRAKLRNPRVHGDPKRISRMPRPAVLQVPMRGLRATLWTHTAGGSRATVTSSVDGCCCCSCCCSCCCWLLSKRVQGRNDDRRRMRGYKASQGHHRCRLSPPPRHCR